jgi:hypothetical protein
VVEDLIGDLIGICQEREWELVAYLMRMIPFAKMWGNWQDGGIVEEKVMEEGEGRTAIQSKSRCKVVFKTSITILSMRAVTRTRSPKYTRTRGKWCRLISSPFLFLSFMNINNNK